MSAKQILLLMLWDPASDSHACMFNFRMFHRYRAEIF